MRLVNYQEKEQAGKGNGAPEDEHELRDRYHPFYEHMMDPFFIFELLRDAGGTVVDVILRETNLATERLLGHEARERIGEQITELRATLGQGFFDAYGRVERTGEGERREVYNPRIDRCFESIIFRFGPGKVGVISRDVTERKRMEDALRESEARYKLLLEHAPTAIYEIDFRDGRLKSVNDAMSELTGYSRDELLSMSAIDLLDEESGRRFKERVKRALSGENIESSADYVVIRKDGGRIDAALKMRFDMEEGRPVGALVVGHDVTGRKRAEEAALRSRSMLKQVLDTVPLPVFWKDLELNYLGCNRVAARQAGLSDPEDIVGKSDLDLAWKASADIYRADDREIIRTGVPKLSYEEPQVQADGGRLVLRTSKLPLRDPNGRIIGVLGTYEDITERKRQEDALKDSEERLRAVVESSADAVYRRDLAVDRYDYMSPVIEQMLGLTVAEMMSLSMHQLLERIHPDDRGKVAAELERSIAAGRGSVIYRFMATDGGYRWLSDRFTVIRAADGRVLSSGVVRDVTESMQYNEALRKANEKLERSNEELQQFAYVASHDLQEPLRMVTSYLGLLEMRYGGQLSDEARRYMHFAVDGSMRMKRLIDDLLQYSRIESGPTDLTDVDMGEVARATVKELHVAIEDAGAVVTIGDLPTVHADAMQMRQLLSNLISNAVKFHGPSPRIVVSSARDGDDLVFSVSDNGIGIEPRFHDKLFKMFSRLHTRDEYPGTGMGLAIAKRIVERHGGRIWFESEVGKGTTFHFALPVRSASGPEADESLRP